MEKINNLRKGHSNIFKDEEMVYECSMTCGDMLNVRNNINFLSSNIGKADDCINNENCPDTVFGKINKLSNQIEDLLKNDEIDSSLSLSRKHETTLSERMSEKFISPECMASIIGRISYINFDNVDPVFGSVQANTGCSSGIEGYSCQLEYINSIDWNSYCKSL